MEEFLQNTEMCVDLSNFSNQNRKNGSVHTTRKSRANAIAGIDSSFFSPQCSTLQCRCLGHNSVLGC